jgi:hypothetical protein
VIRWFRLIHQSRQRGLSGSSNPFLRLLQRLLTSFFLLKRNSVLGERCRAAPVDYCFTLGPVLRVFLDHLPLAQFAVAPCLSHQALVVALLDNPSFFQYQDLIGFLHGGESMGDHQNRAPGHGLL